MTAKKYVPEAGEIVWINFTPQAGHEQAGHRPALVLSPAAYNGKTNLMICCPLTTQIKNYPFEVFIGGTPPNAVLADQVKSLDWRSRDAKPKGRVSAEQLDRSACEDTGAHWITAPRDKQAKTVGFRGCEMNRGTTMVSGTTGGWR